jgi:hypothetical protein
VVLIIYHDHMLCGPIIHRCLLYHMIFANVVVPGKFGNGCIISLVKDKSGNLSNVATYPGMTLIPVT